MVIVVVAVFQVSSSKESGESIACLTAMETHMPYGINCTIVTCHLAKVIFSPLPQPIKAGIRFSDPEGCKAELT